MTRRAHPALILLHLALPLALLLATTGCSSDSTTPDLAVPDTRASGGDRARADLAVPDRPAPDAPAHGPRVLLRTSMGDLKLELDEKLAPITVANFLGYVDTKFYDGTIFHRVISTFMIQGGGFDESFTQKPTQPAIKNEAANGLSNVRGTVAMARTKVVDSATAQFFINVVDNAFLNHKDDTEANFGYAVFGKVIEGMDVVDQIKAVPTGAKGPFDKDCPLTNVVIQSAARTN